MFGELLYTPTQDKYSASQWASKNDRSQTYSQLQKSYSAHKSTEIGSHSPMKETTVSRLEQAKRTIDSVIVDLNQKRDMNDQAIREVRSVNSQFVDQFRKGSKVYSSFDKENASTYVPENKSNRGSVYDLKASAQPQDETLLLRGKLNEELKKNNDLMLRVSRLEQQNQMMKRDYEMSFGPSQARELQAQNERLRQALSQVSQLPQQIFTQIENLKRQNQQLRGDTVKLLRKVDRVV